MNVIKKWTMSVLEHNKDTDTIDQAIKALRETAGLPLQITEYQAITHNTRADALITLAHNNRNYTFVVEVKHVDRFSTIAQVKQQLDAFNQAPLLIAPRLTDAAALQCKELGLNFIDLAGNAYINTEDFFVLIKGQKREQKLLNPLNPLNGNKALTPTHLRMVFALLCNPKLLNAPYREIAKEAGIALGTVGWGFNDLATRALTLGDGKKHDRIFTQPEKLIQEWVTNYPIKLRPKLSLKRFKASHPEWWQTLDVKQYEAQWGGEVAADKLTHYLKPNHCLLYMHGNQIHQNTHKLIVENRLVPDSQGDIEVIEAFWHFDDAEHMPELVPHLLIYADLIASNHPRNLETARLIYERLIHHASH